MTTQKCASFFSEGKIMSVPCLKDFLLNHVCTFFACKPFFQVNLKSNGKVNFFTTYVIFDRITFHKMH